MNTAKTQTVEADDIGIAQVPALAETGMVSAIVRAELDTQISTAKMYPRSLKNAIDNIMSLATLDEQTAADCMFALPRAGKPIRGPSIRLAEIIAQQWGNCRVEARVIAVDRPNRMIVAEGTFHDLETNSATRSVVQRRISDKRGRIYNDDMIVVTGNAACSIARRNAILAGVPKAVWRKAYEASEQVVAGDIKTLAARREAAIKAFATYGVKPEQVFAALEINGLEEISLEHIPTLQGMFSALKNGETTVEELFDPHRNTAQNFEVVKNPLKDEPEEQVVVVPGTQQPVEGSEGTGDGGAGDASPSDTEGESAARTTPVVEGEGSQARTANQLSIEDQAREDARKGERAFKAISEELRNLMNEADEAK